MVDKNEEMLKKYNFKRNPNESIYDTLEDFWQGLSYGDQYEILDNCGFEIRRQGWDDEDGTYDEYWKDMDWENKIEIYMDYINGIRR